MRLFHLSHTDLDGYGCQFISKKFFDSEIEFYNANYGPEVLAKLTQILNRVELLELESSSILITDLNLTINECNFLELKRDELKAKGFNIELKLLDHHITGKESDEAFDWYFLDITKSATMLTYEYFSKLYSRENNLSRVVKAINAIDIWLEDDELFEFGKVLLRIANVETREISQVLFPDEAREYKHYMIERAIEFIDMEDANIELDDSILAIKKSYLSNRRDTLDNLISENIVNLLGAKRKEMEIFYRGYRGIFTNGIGSISVIANSFLKKFDDEFYFFIDVNYRGNVGIRANGKCDVGEFAKEVFSGGGHLNASGGKIKDFKEIFDYKQMREFVQEYIQEKTQGD